MRGTGRAEAAGVTVKQRIPRGSLPRKEPATLHVRIAPPVLPSAAHLEFRGPANRLLYTSVGDPDRSKPAISMSLPQTILDENARHPVELDLVSFGSYGDFQYLLFPVIPPPWAARAAREGGGDLSPSTGIRSGAFDWWAHSGRD